MPPEISEAIARLDKASAEWPEDLVNDWRRVRGYCRARRGMSEQVLPAVNVAAHEIAEARHHAKAALDAMVGVFGTVRVESSDEEDP